MTPTVETVKRQADAHGAYCEACQQAFNITTSPYWHWSKSAAMHRDGTGHRTVLYRLN